MTTLLRTCFIMFALSFHSLIEGLVMGLEETNAGVWMNFGALALHKFVIAFILGVDLMSNKVNKTKQLTVHLLYERKKKDFSRFPELFYSFLSSYFPWHL